MLIAGGEKHRTGEGELSGEYYRRLEEFAAVRFGIQEFAYRWSTQDNYSIDHVPYIGPLRPGSDHLYVATGFGAWGMTNGTLAGMILSDAVLGRNNPWAEFYSPNRVDVRASVGRLLTENLKVARHLVGDRFGPEVESPAKVMAGKGMLVDADGRKVAIYRDEQGDLHVLSAYCTHTGCVLSWNAAEQSWDCPCHGSRFSIAGEVIHGPAVENLQPIDISI